MFEKVHSLCECCSFKGGDIEEAETSSVKIVTSPYVTDMSKTKKYFAPGSKISILVCQPYVSSH